MTAVIALSVAAIIDFAWVVARVRREWSNRDELSPVAAGGISSLYLLGGALIVSALVARPWPIAIQLAGAIAAGGVLIAAGLGLVAVGARPFGSIPRLYGVEKGGLIEGGVYRLSRNPQYAGLILAAFGTAVVARSTLMLAVALLLTGAVWVWVVAVEEPHLAREFGSRYDRYTAEVPRFLGVASRWTTVMRGPTQINVRRLAALDMHGARGTPRRRRIILAEFALGTVGCAALGVWSLSRDGLFGLVLGVWLLGLAANYLPLTAYVCSLWRTDKLQAELAGVDLSAELRHYTRTQTWVLVPFWVAGLAIAQARRSA
jgi:protein-S-isoprenylcysteine O-methyltransferase Ste14